MSIDSVLRIILELEAAGVTLGAGNSSAALKAMEAQAKRTEAELQRLKRAGAQLQQVSQGLALGGAAIAGPLIAAANAYVSQTGRAEVASRRWLDSTDKIHTAFIGVGRVAATAVGPELEKLASLAETAARFAQANPNAVKAALGIGGGLIALGALGSIAAKGIQIYADVKLLAAAALQQTAANTMLAAAQLQAGAAGAGGGAGGIASKLLPLLGGLAAIAPILVAGFAGAAGVGYAASRVGERVLGPVYDAAGKQIVALLERIAAKPGTMVGAAVLDDERGNTDNSYGQYLTDRYAAAKTSAQGAFNDYTANKAGAASTYRDTRMAILDDFQKTYWDNEANYAQSRGRNVRDFERQETQAVADFNTSRARQLRDFAAGEAQNEKGYYEDRLKRARDYGLDEARAEQDHQDELLRLQSDHADRSDDLARAGDALGFVKEQRAYEKSRAESEKQYAKDAGRRDADYARELADGEKAFTEQRAQRLADFELQQADAAADFKAEQDRRADEQRQRLRDMDSDFDESQRKLKSQRDQRLLDLDANYKLEQAHIEQAFIDTLNAIDPILTGMTKAVETKMQDASDAFQDFLDGIKSQAAGGPGYCQPGYHWNNQTKSCMKDQHPGTGGAAGGGYVGYGMRLLGEAGNEFVLSHGATSAAERLVGGPLTQDNILAALSRGNSYAVNLGDFNFAGGGPGAALAQTLELVRSEITEAFTQFSSALES